jgi:Flp pilus assembly secretin CpaC
MSGSSSAGASSGSTDQVKNDIQTAFRNEPTLTSSNISVDVSSDSITLSGTAASQKDRDEAKRIAQSFAGNRRVVDNIKVSGGSDMSTPSSTSPGMSPSTTPNSTSPNSSVTPNSTATPNSTNPEQPSVPKN